LPVDSFTFRGFLPAKTGARRRQLEAIRDSPQTEIFYEAPHRLRETMTEVVEVLGSTRRIVIARELTKVHEEFLRGTAAKMLEKLQSHGEVKGEITLLVSPASSGEFIAPAQSVRERVEQIMREEKLDEKSALKKAAKERGISKSEAYRMMQKRK
jgi:16S rRNA (cytidine1402-2'-O)-methyltransferase